MEDEKTEVIELDTIEEITPSEAVTESIPQQDPETVSTAPEPVPSLADTVKEIRAEYEKKLADDRAYYEAEIRERDATIKEILTEPSEPAVNDYDPITERINAKRNYRKW